MSGSSGLRPDDTGAVESLTAVLDQVRRLSRENERLFHRLVAGEQRFRGLAKAVWSVQEEERRRLARDLHDGIGQTLTALKNQLHWLRDRQGPSEFHEELSQACEVASEALRETRELSRLLRPAVLDDLGLEPALRQLARTAGHGTKVRIEVSADGDDLRPPSDLETVLFRIAQEALSNVLRHASATRARLHLVRSPTRLFLTVEDDGSGFEPESVLSGGSADGIGLRGMQDRAELFGGRVEISSRPGHGARVTVELPVTEDEGDG